MFKCVCTNKLYYCQRNMLKIQCFLFNDSDYIKYLPTFSQKRKNICTIHKYISN